MHHETRVLLDRALPLERAGQWESAMELRQEAFRRSVAAGDIDTILESVLSSGLCARQAGDRLLASDYLELAWVLADLHKRPLFAGRALNGLATIHHVHGELDAAEHCYLEAHQIALVADDLLTLGNVEQNLGTLANIRGELETAIVRYQSALECYDRAGHQRGKIGVLNNMGMLQLDSKRFDAASVSLSEALVLSKQLGDVVSESIILTNQTELLVHQGLLDLARTVCDEAFEIVSRLGENGSRSDILKLYGVIYRETGKLFLSETHLREAIEVAIIHELPMEEAEAQRELAAVLRAQSRNREALEALNRAHELFSGLRAVHSQADIDSRLDRLQNDFLSLVQAWGESIEAKDRYTRGHCQRVADYACRIAAQIGIQDRDMIWFRMGALLHDVGKTEVPGEILNKPGQLTQEEREIMERHTIIGDEMLSDIPFPWDVRPMVRSHHERWDGRGYPDGLKGDAIPLTARVLRIADVFDALTTTRSYRNPLTPDQALRIMQDDHGAYDPELFEVFLRLFPVLSELSREALVAVDGATEKRSPAPS